MDTIFDVEEKEMKVKTKHFYCLEKQSSDIFADSDACSLTCPQSWVEEILTPSSRETPHFILQLFYSNSRCYQEVIHSG